MSRRAPADGVASRAYAEFTRPHGDPSSSRGARDTTTVHDRFVFGGHGVSATGVSGGLPTAHAKRLSTTSWSILSRVATDAEPRWGNNTTWSIAISSAGTPPPPPPTPRPPATLVFSSPPFFT